MHTIAHSAVHSSSLSEASLACLSADWLSVLCCAGCVSLRVSHNCLSSLCDLSSLAALTRLYVDENELIELPGHLLPSSLRSLSASSNRLVRVADMHRLPRLTELNVAGNRLSHLHWLDDGMAALRRLNVAGNRLCSPSCLLPLRSSHSLSSLSVADGQYGPNPLCSLHNWRVVLLHSLPRLRSLDGLLVSEAEVERVDCLWRKKAMYYSRRRQRLKRGSIDLQRAIAKHCQQAASAIDGLRRRAWQLRCAMDELQWAQDEPPSLSQSEAAEGREAGSTPFAECRSLVRSSVAACNREVRRLVASYRASVSALALRQSELLQAMDVEMDSGGNVRWDESEQLLQAAARLLEAERASVQLVRAVQLKDAEYRMQVQLTERGQRPTSFQQRTAVLDDDDETEPVVCFIPYSPTDAQLGLPLSVSTALPFPPAVWYHSAPRRAVSCRNRSSRQGRAAARLQSLLPSTDRRAAAHPMRTGRA